MIAWISAADLQTLALAFGGFITPILAAMAYWRGRKNTHIAREALAEIKSTNGQPTGAHVVHASEGVAEVQKSLEALFDILEEKDRRDVRRFRRLERLMRSHSHDKTGVLEHMS